MFREEKYVEINGVRISKNGFKNLAFETSRFSDGYEAVRGFGSIMNERNLNIIDTISLDFFVDYTELKEFALVYSMFKAYGALPIKNEYILDKIKSTLSYEKTIKQFKDGDKKKKNIDQLIVFLERMEITSLERTDSGFSVNMILTLYKNGYSADEYDTFRKKYELWDKETNFSALCNEKIEEYVSKIKTSGGISIEIYNIEKLNAGYKNSALLQITNERFTVDEKIEKENEFTERKNALLEFEDLNKFKKIEIPPVNIGQIELITHNNISNIPLLGEPIGIKSYMGIGKTSFTAKMIFDESDSAILSELKELSDVNIVSHKIKLNTPLVNLFDFHSATITNVFFNNVEEANGVMVTIKFDVNGYNYFSDELNLNSTLNLEEVNSSDNNVFNTALYLEAIIQDMYTNKNGFNKEKINYLFSSVIATKTFDKYEEEANSGARENVDVYRQTFEHFVSSYISNIATLGIASYNSSQGTYKFPEFEIEDNLFNNKFNIEIDKTTYGTSKFNTLHFGSFFGSLSDSRVIFSTPENNQYDGNAYEVSNNKDLFKTQDMWNTDTFYKFFDLVGLTNIYSNDEYLKYLRLVFKSDNSFVDNDSVFSKDTVFKTVNQMYNNKNAMDTRTGEFAKAVYSNIFYDIFDITEGALKNTINDLKDKSIINTAGIDFKTILKEIDKMLSKITEEFNYRLNNDYFIDECVKLVLLEVSKGNLSSGYTFDNTYAYLEDYIHSFREQLKHDFNFNFNKIKNRTYCIFLTKTLYSLAILIHRNKGNEFVDKVSIEKLIKSNIISSSFIGSLMFRTSDRTDSLGFRMVSGTNNIGKKLSEYFYLIKEFKKSELGPILNDFEDLASEQDIIYDYFGTNVYNSAVIDNVVFSVKELNEKIKENGIKKDHSFFYGKEIDTKDTEEIILSFNSETSISEAKTKVEWFIEKAIMDFCKDEKYVNIEEIPFDYGHQTFVVPTYHKQLFNDENKINSIMKKRIIGNDDPFRNLQKITDLVTNRGREIIPDYEILVKKTDYNFQGSGIYSSVEFKNSMSLNNVASVRISKDPGTKIKSAIITIIDFNKQIVNMDSVNSSISFKFNREGKIELFTIETGDSIVVSLGYKNDRSCQFNGIINNINTNGSIVEITCSGLASSLYSETISEMNLGPKGIVSKTLNFVHSIFKSVSRTSDVISKNYFNDIFNKRSCNNHILNSLGKDHNEVFREDECSSMYNAFNALLAFLPSSAKNRFLGINNFDNSTNGQFLQENLTNIFGNVDEVKNSNSTATTTQFFRNIYNVDADYETYGLFKADRTFGNTVVEYTSEQVNYNEVESNLNDMNDVADSEEKIDDTTKFLFPCKSRRITSPFDLQRLHPKTGKLSPHRAIDIGPIRDENWVAHDKDNYIYATESGVIQLAGFDSVSGNKVEIVHDNGQDVSSRYYHLKSIEAHIKPGVKVKRGDVIGIMGTTGRSTGVHLHFEIRIKGIGVDPTKYLG